MRHADSPAAAAAACFSKGDVGEGGTGEVWTSAVVVAACNGCSVGRCSVSVTTYERTTTQKHSQVSMLVPTRAVVGATPDGRGVDLVQRKSRRRTGRDAD